MSSIDIRTVTDEVTQIVFADKDESKRSDYAVAISGARFSHNYVFITSNRGAYVSVYIEDIPNLIKALEKAKDMLVTSK